MQGQGQVKAHLPAVIALVAAICIAIWAFTLPPGLALRASVLGPVTGFFPIGWIVLNVIFLYRLAVEKGSFELLQRTIGNVSPDRHIQPLLIAFSFGAFRFVFKHSITLACLVGVLVVLQAYVFTGMVIHR